MQKRHLRRKRKILLQVRHGNGGRGEMYVRQPLVRMRQILPDVRQTGRCRVTPYTFPVSSMLHTEGETTDTNSGRSLSAQEGAENTQCGHHSPPRKESAPVLSRYQMSHCTSCGCALEPGVLRESPNGLYADATSRCGFCIAERERSLALEARQ